MLRLARGHSFRESGLFSATGLSLDLALGLLGVAALVSAGGIVYFAVAWVIGAMDKDDILILLRRKKVS